MLELQDVGVGFGGVRAVDGCSFMVERGSITGLIGPNGAGKTTVFNLITGFARADCGRILFAGRRIERLGAHRIARLGLTRTFQLAKAAPNMTVLESLMLAGRDQAGEFLPWAWLRGPLVRRQEEALAERAAEVLRFLQLHGLAMEFAGNLSVGQKKLLEIGRGLMAEPKLFLLDEPGAGVNPTLAQKIAGYIEALRRGGMTILLIEHNMDLISRLCDTVVVMSEGRVLTQGTPAEVQQDDRVIAAYLGGGAA